MSLITTMVFIGAVAEVKILWSFMDLILASMAVPHMATLLRHVFKKTTPAMVESKHSA